MAGKRRSSVNEGIQADNIQANSIAVGKGARAITNLNQGSANVDQIFAALAERVAKLPEGAEKEIAKSAVGALEGEAKLGENAKEANVDKWLNFLAQAAPDIWEVAIATFINPVVGLGVVFRKVAERSQKEQSQKQG
jgi:hypothetical protein